MKDGKIFQKVYMRNKRGKDKGKVTIKLKRLHIPVRRANIVANQQTVQLEGDVVVEVSTQLEDSHVIEDSTQLEDGELATIEPVCRKRTL